MIPTEMPIHSHTRHEHNSEAIHRMISIAHMVFVYQLYLQGVDLVPFIRFMARQLDMSVGLENDVAVAISGIAG